MTTDTEPAGDSIDRLLKIMARLRDPETGCPWDVEQSYATIAPYTIEEAYEVADAIEREAYGELKDELGDLLLQVVYLARIAAEEGRFTFRDVAESISDKMVRRHPHVFGEESRDKTALDQTRDWERIKAAERADAGGGSAGKPVGALAGVALGLPALTRALKLQKRAARVGFDWGNAADVLAKVHEEASELEQAAAKMSADDVEDEMGDLLFVLANLARHLEVDPEKALRRTNAKFARRFAAIEAALRAEGRGPQDSSLAEMDAMWDAAKAAERQD